MNILRSIKTNKIRIKGLFASPIPYEIRNEKGDWSPYFGQYEGQKHDDLDSNCCWAYSGNEVLEDSLEFLMNTSRMAQEDIKWFRDNGYIDEDGDFYLSRRFIPILSGVKRNGNDPENFWKLTLKYGAIPSAKLPFTNNIDYFDTAFITEEMYTLGEEFLKHIKIGYEELGSRWTVRTPDDIKWALKQGELVIGLAVPHDGSWNQEKVNFPAEHERNLAEHAVALWKYDEVADPEYPYFIYDQYQPNLKQLSKDYYLPLITRVVINPINMLSPKLSLSTWIQFVNLLRKIGVLVDNVGGTIKGVIK